MANKTGQNLVNGARKRSGYQNSGFVTDDEILEWINDARAEFYDLMNQQDESVYSTPYEFTVPDPLLATAFAEAGLATPPVNYAMLPANLDRIQGLDYLPDGLTGLGGGSGGIPTTAPTLDGLFWYAADLTLTKDGSNRVSQLNDMFGVYNMHQLSQGNTGVMRPVGDWPVYTPNVLNGKPGLLFNGSSTIMNFIPGAGVPPNNGEAVTVLAVARMTAAVGGALVTFRGANFDLEIENMQRGGASQLMATEQDARAVGITIADFTGQSLLYTHEFRGAAATPQAVVAINNVDQVMMASGPLTAYNGTSLLSLGYCNAVFGKYWPGYIFEVIGYRGNNPATIAAARAYLSNKWGLGL